MGRNVCGGSQVVMVACGDEHTLALTRAWHVWNCGYGQVGQTGHRPTGETGVPTQVPSVERIALVAVGSHYSLEVAAEGRLWPWGDDRDCPRENDELPLFPGNWTHYVPWVLELSAFGGSAVLLATGCTRRL